MSIGGTTASRNLTIAGTGATLVSGAMADGAFAGNLTVTNTGVTTLSGANSYSGATTMNAAAGTLRLQGSNSSAGVTTLTTGTMQFDSATNAGMASGLFTITAGSLQALNAPRSMSNNALLNGNFNVIGSESLTIGGGNSTQNGSRTITNTMTGGTFRIENFSLSNSATGRTLTVGGTGATVIGNLTNSNVNNTLTSTVTTGSLTVDNAVYLSEATGTGRTLTINGIGNTTISGSIQNFNGGPGTAGNIVKAGAGVLTLSGANTYTGATTINESIVRAAANDVSAKCFVDHH